MLSTNWSNPHGLPDGRNVSTVEDITKLCQEAWKCPLLKEIIKTKYYNCQIIRGFDYCKVEWENTNRLQFKDSTYCVGMKTGITKTAGPCLASVFNKEGKEIQCIVLHTETTKRRFTESLELFKWSINNLDEIMALPVDLRRRE